MAQDNWFKRLFKQSPSRTMIAMQRPGQPVSTPRNYEGFASEGYSKNNIAFKAISDISEAVGSLKWMLKKRRVGGVDVEVTDQNHPLLKLLRNPNPMQSHFDLFQSLTGFFMISGNAYLEGVSALPGGPIRELWVPRPDRMKIIPGEKGIPVAYQYCVGAAKHTYYVDQVKGTSPIMHLKTFNPLDDWYGMSPIEAASFSVDQHNESGKWNLAMLQNMATPSGALVVSVSDRNPKGSLTDEQFDRLEKKLDEKITGANNARRPLILEGGLDWRSMGLSATDMDWLNGKNVSARDIAIALGYPPILLGIPGDSTYNNYKEARLALYEDTVIPTANFIAGGMNRWLTPTFGPDLYLDFDRDEIDALAPRREALWDRLNTSTFLTLNEKREALGYNPVTGGDVVMVSMGQMPLDQMNAGLEDNDSGDASDYEDED